MALTDPANNALPPAVPPYSVDVDELHRHLGQMTVYVGQLTVEMHNRAVETNSIHNELLAAQARIVELEQQLAGGL